MSRILQVMPITSFIFIWVWLVEQSKSFFHFSSSIDSKAKEKGIFFNSVWSMANDQQNHIVENNGDAANIQDGLSAAELFANRDGLTYK